MRQSSACGRALVWATTLGGAAYATAAGATFGLRSEHVAVPLLAVVASLWNDRSRRLLRTLVPFLLAAIAYDISRLAAPLVLGRPIHILEPYHADRALFGLEIGGRTLPPHEIFARHHWAWVDLVTGAAYMLYPLVPVAVALYLEFGRSAPRHRSLSGALGRAFVLVNLAGLVTYFVYPAAPPWYVTKYGFGQPQSLVPPDPAGAARWDALTGIPYFAGFYARSAHVFGAIPSLHVAIPLLAFLYGRLLRNRAISLGTFGFAVLVAFSAVYLQHHYVVDLVAGAGYAVAAFGAERLWARRSHRRRNPCEPGREICGGARESNPPSAPSRALHRF